MLSHRFVAFFARAGVKYRINRCAETAAARSPPADPIAIAEALLAFTGYATPASRPPARGRRRARCSIIPGCSPAARAPPKNSRRLFPTGSGARSKIVQFAGAWLFLAARPADLARRGSQDRRLEPARRRRRDRRARLGSARAHHPAHRAARSRHRSRRLLPDRPGLQRLVSLVRAFLGFEIGFAVNPVLAGPEVPPLRLDRRADPSAAARLELLDPGAGRPATWGMRRADAADALFEAEIVEAEELAGTGTPLSAIGQQLGRRLRYRRTLPSGLLPAPIAAASQSRLPARRRRRSGFQPGTPLSYLGAWLRPWFRGARPGRLQPVLAVDRYRLQPGSHRCGSSARGRGRHCQYPVHRGRSRRSGGGSRGSRDTRSRCRQPARLVELGDQTRSATVLSACSQPRSGRAASYR